MTVEESHTLRPTEMRTDISKFHIQRKATKSILQSNPKYQPFNFGDETLLTPTLQRRSADAPHNSTNGSDFRGSQNNTTMNIPDSYIETIVQAFGLDADLMRDVLQVPAEVAMDARKLRICYFRRGRQILKEAGGLETTLNQRFSSPIQQQRSENNALDPHAKLRFQAVNMAYEIISRPAWKEQYYQQQMFQNPSSMKSQQIKKKIHIERHQDGLEYTRNSVRWSEQVEELIYEREAEEQADLLKWKNQRKKKKTKPRIVVDEELEDHLAKIDAESESHFTNDFFDTLEESLDGLLKITGAKKQSVHEEPSPAKPPTPSVSGPFNEEPNYEVNAIPGVDLAASNDDDSLVGMLTSHLLRLSGTNATTPAIVPLSNAEAQEPFRCVSPDPCRSMSPTNEEELVDMSSEKADSNTSSKKAVAVVDEDDDIFEGIEDEDFSERQPSSIILPPRAHSPSNISTVSDLSESIAAIPKTQTNQGTFFISPSHRTVITETRSVSSSVARQVFQSDAIDEEVEKDGNIWDPFSISTKGNQDKTSSAIVSPEKSSIDSSEAASSNDDGFMAAVASYFQAIAEELASMGKSFSEMDWQDTMVDIFITEDDVVQLMNVVADEVQQTPALSTEDAVQAPTLFAIEAARSFS